MTDRVVAEHIARYFTSGSAIRRMFEEGLRLKASHGADAVADLSIGNPDFDPPPEFLEALQRVAALKGHHAYMPNAGYPHVRGRIADYLNQHRYFDGITRDKIIMTTGAAGALNIVLATLLARGEEVIVIAPYFVEYRFYVEAHAGVVRLADTDDHFDLDIDRIAGAITDKTRAVMVNSPNNPSGRVYSRSSLEKLAALLTAESERRGHPIFLISDEPYREILYTDEAFVSPASVYRNSFMCYSWSKSFSISGERIGYVAINPSLQTDDWGLLIGSLAMCNRSLGFVNAPALMQKVIAESVDARVDISHYREKRELLRQALDDGGFEYADPDGTFYFFVRTPEAEVDFIDRARKHLLLVVPGTDFGRPGYFRISYAAPRPTIELACRKLLDIAKEIAGEKVPA
ncbi:MAG: pyridoxal phosphate-dependent aminotransferase [Rhodothermales bacterium]|nr:pyridoxal phosphate-dependent aminotransferase [Rhodothermales bacterium]